MRPTPRALGIVGEELARLTLEEAGYLVYRPRDLLRLAALASARLQEGPCEEPQRPVSVSLRTEAGYLRLTYWRGRCWEGGEVESALESSVHAPCVARCVRSALDGLPEGLLPLLRRLASSYLAFRGALETVDLFAYRDGRLYAVEVKTNGGRPSDFQLEKAEALKRLGFIPLLLRLRLEARVEIATR